MWNESLPRFLCDDIKFTLTSGIKYGIQLRATDRTLTWCLTTVVWHVTKMLEIPRPNIAVMIVPSATVDECTKNHNKGLKRPVVICSIFVAIDVYSWPLMYIRGH